MKIKKFFKIIFTFSLLTVCSQSFAYVIYNQTDVSVQVKDTVGLRGISMAIPAHGSIACDPSASGCSGSMNFKVSSTNFTDNTVMCGWSGVIPKGAGNYFVISKVPNIDFPTYGSCNMEYYHQN